MLFSRLQKSMLAFLASGLSAACIIVANVARTTRLHHDGCCAVKAMRVSAQNLQAIPFMI
jgi:hypothetical protein